MPHGVSCHLIWPFEEWLVLDLLQNLVYWLLEHSINYLPVSRFRLPCKVPPRSVIIVPVPPEIPYLLRDNLSLSFPLLLVFLNPFLFVNSVHEFAYVGNRLAS